MGLFKTAFSFAKKHVGKAINLAKEYDKANGHRFSKSIASMAGKSINTLANAHPLAKIAANHIGDYIAKNSENTHLQKFGKGLRGDKLTSDIKKPTSNINTNNSNAPSSSNGRRYNYVKPVRF